MRSIRKTGFTMIEMLTVIVIIGILAGLMLTAGGLARKRARLAKAETEVRDLTKAWKAYWLTYGKWPSGFTTDMPMDAAAMNILQGNNATHNPKSIKFMEVGAEATINGYKDPWGELYRVDFSKTSYTEVEYYETTVQMPNKKRYFYE